MKRTMKKGFNTLVFISAAACAALTTAACQETPEEPNHTVAAALDAEYIMVDGVKNPTENKSFMYNTQSYVPLKDMCGYFNVSLSFDEGTQTFSADYNGNKFTIDYKELITKNEVGYISAAAFTELTGITVSWHEGLLYICENGEDITAEQAESLKQELEYTAYEDKYEEVVEFSEKGGFYETPVTVELTSNLENAVIYYTTDGSDPVAGNAANILYTAPITIEDRTAEPNSLSMISYVVEDGFAEPVGNVAKATCIKARAYNKDNPEISSKISVSTYFVGSGMTTRYKDARVVSITAPYDNLFAPDTGIYTYANSVNLSVKNEVSGYIEVFGKDGDREFRQPIGLCLNGAGTRVLQQKSLRVYARENADYENGTRKNFKQDLFDGTVVDSDGEPIKKYKTFLLRSSGDDWTAFFCRSAATHDLCKATGIDIQGYSPAVVFLNGEYWGVHWIRERYDQNYFKNHYKLENKEDVVGIEIAKNAGTAELSWGEDADLQDFLTKASFVIDNDMTDPANYEKAAMYFDVDNLIDYYSCNVFIENQDWPHNNVKMWRNKNENNTTVDTRWRAVLSDVDDDFQNVSGHYPEYYGEGSAGTLGFKMSRDESLFNNIFVSLMDNESFRNQFAARYSSLISTVFTTENIKNSLAKVHAMIAPLREEHVRRYPNSWTCPDVTPFDSWAENRPARADEELNNYMWN